MKYFIILLLCIGVSYCNNTRDQDPGVRKIKLANGGFAIIPGSPTDRDSSMNGTVRFYSKEGNLTDMIDFKNSLKNGWHRHYIDGRLISKIMFENDMANGEGVFYDKSGKIEQESYYYNNKTLMTRFFDSGKHTTLVDFYDDSVAFYAIKYDISGKKINEKGVVFSHNFFSNQPLNLVKKNTELEIKIPIVSLPGYRTNIEIAEFNLQGKVYDIIDSIPLARYLALYKTTFKEVGIHKIGIAGELKDSLGNIVIRDTLYREITVTN